ncbi:hypothetical protein VIGAN_10244100 [Vigna angularis var. angularis]|uniref:Pectinesterase n=1 Tax=Vigna angularis var. angularis TaxID=157739 RepID=A0A0S3T6E7_PHAAN|nr:hypothetical protein VIGAN_10244100 [Vigna angularis var. angularis]
MATHQSLLDNPRKSVSKTICLIFSVAVVLTSSALIASYLSKPSPLFNHGISHRVCDHAIDPSACLAHVLEVEQDPMFGATQNHRFGLLQSFLMKSTSHIERVIGAANAMRVRMNNPGEEAALRDCVELMELSVDRVWDSKASLTKGTTDSAQDAHTWLSSVLTNHVTCLEGLKGRARRVMEAEVQDLISRARSSLAMFVAVLPPNPEVEVVSLNGKFPSWVRSKDRRLLESSAGEIKANVVVAQDGSGDFFTVAEALATVPDKSKKRYVIHVKNGTYIEKLEIGKKQKNVMLVGDSMDLTIITGNVSVTNETSTFHTATVAAVGDGFIAQDIWFKNFAGPEKHQAVALRVGADQSVINRCRVDAYQDTLYVHSNRQFYRDSYVTGTVDFIFGNAAAVFQNCTLEARKPMKGQKNMVTAQSRTDPNQNTGISIQQCNISPSEDLRPEIKSFKTYLGRPWQNFSRTVVMQSFLDKHIDPEGWSEWDDKHKSYLETLYYGEYMNRGPGAGTGGRVNWTGYHIIKSAAVANQFTVKNLIQGDVWLKNSGVNFIEGL